MLTRAGYALLSASAILLVSALPTGNTFLLVLALFPLAYFLLSALGDRPRDLAIERTLPERPPRVGDPMEVRVRFRAHGGTGLLEVHQPLPPVFELVEGSNLAVFPKRRGALTGELRFTIKAPRRGVFTLPPVDWELVPGLGFSASVTGRAGGEETLEVKPSLVSFKKMLGVKTASSTLFPENDAARLGVQTTEFQDIRTYQRGDPPRTINWKATARLLAREKAYQQAVGGTGPDDPTGAKARGRLVPLVNEYEHEGKKAVWIFLDSGPHMRVGTSAHSVFEAALEAAQATAQFFIDRGFRVGFTIFGRPEPVHIYPDTGRRQMFRIREELAAAEPTIVRADLPVAIEQVKRFLLMMRGLVIVVTRADAADDATVAGLRRLRGLVTRRRARRAPVLVVSPDAYGLVPDAHPGTEAARRIQRWLDQDRIRAVRRLGVEVLPWDPTTSRFETVLARRAGAR